VRCPTQVEVAELKCYKTDGPASLWVDTTKEEVVGGLKQARARPARPVRPAPPALGAVDGDGDEDDGACGTFPPPRRPLPGPLAPPPSLPY